MHHRGQPTGTFYTFCHGLLGWYSIRGLNRRGLCLGTMAVLWDGARSLTLNHIPLIFGAHKVPAVFRAYGVARVTPMWQK